MEFNKCSRCGSFYVSNDSVCPKCKAKDNLEFETFKNYVIERYYFISNWNYCKKFKSFYR